MSPQGDEAGEQKPHYCFSTNVRAEVSPLSPILGSWAITKPALLWESDRKSFSEHFLLIRRMIKNLPSSPFTPYLPESNDFQKMGLRLAP